MLNNVTAACFVPSCMCAHASLSDMWVICKFHAYANDLDKKNYQSPRTWIGKQVTSAWTLQNTWRPARARRLSRGTHRIWNIWNHQRNDHSTMGKVFFALKGMCPHSPTYWIRFEKCANTHLNANLLWDVCLHISQCESNGWESEGICP